MSQSDLIIQNQLFPDARADINTALAALGSMQKGPNPPSAPLAGMLWCDDDTPSATVWTIKQYDGTNWIELWRLDTTNNSVDISNSVTLPQDTGDHLNLGAGAMTLIGDTRVDGVLTVDGVDAVMAENDETASLKILNAGGTGDTGLSAVLFDCVGTYAAKLGLRSDGRFGIGGADAGTWRWYVDLETGNTVAAGDVTAFSDPSLKEHLEPLKDYWSLLASAVPYRFVWKHNSKVGRPGAHDVGFLSTDVKKGFPEAHYELEAGLGGVAYTKYVVPLVAAVLELKAEVEALKRK